MSFKGYFKKLSDENKGFIFGFVGILIFSITPPATKMALGLNNNALSPEFITFGRSALPELFRYFIYYFSEKKYQN